MAITSFDDVLAAARQRIPFGKGVNIGTATAGAMATLLDQAGPGPTVGSLNPGNTSSGIVPTDATAGAPALIGFGVGATAYLTEAWFTGSVSGWILIYDRLFTAGNFSIGTTTVTTTLTGQPSFSSRLPTVSGQPDYTGLEIWIEVTGTALSSTAHTVQVNYTDAADASQNTGAISTNALAARRILRLPLAAGGNTVKRIDSVTVNGVASSSGSFNVHVARPIWQGRTLLPHVADQHGPALTGMTEIFPGTNLYFVGAPTGGGTGVPFVELTISNG